MKLAQAVAGKQGLSVQYPALENTFIYLCVCVCVSTAEAGPSSPGFLFIPGLCRSPRRRSEAEPPPPVRLLGPSGCDRFSRVCRHVAGSYETDPYFVRV